MDVPPKSTTAPTVQSIAASPPVAATPPVSYRADVILRASRQIPYTNEGLPVGFYRVDLLPQTRPSTAQEEMHAIKNAYVDLSYEHGYPTLPDGRPFWHKLDFEPGFAYGVFEKYLEQIDAGPRELSQLSKDVELRTIATKVYCKPEDLKILSISDPYIQPSRLHQIFHEFSVLYNWRSRAKAHDIYKDAAYRHVRMRRQMTVEENHYSLAERLMKDLKDKVIDKGAEFWDNMSAKTAVDMLKALVAIQRISVGLPAAGPLSQKEQPEDVNFEMILRTLAAKTGNNGNVYDNGGGQLPGRQILDQVLSDPNAAAGMQELIVRVTRQSILPNTNQGTQARTFKGRGRSTQLITDEDFTGGIDISGAPGENLDTIDESPSHLHAEDAEIPR